MGELKCRDFPFFEAVIMGKKTVRTAAVI